MTTVDDILPMVITEPNSGCWIWAGAWDASGYGIHTSGKARTPAYRWVWLALRGEIDHGMHLDHLCMVKCCVNPNHLEVVTKKENFRRKREKGRSARTFDVVDIEREARESAHRQIDRLYSSLRDVSKEICDLDGAVASRLAKYLRNIDVHRVQQQALLDESLASLDPRQASEPITVGEVKDLLKAVVRLTKRREAA
jgi:HNH endonuclease